MVASTACYSTMQCSERSITETHQLLSDSLRQAVTAAANASAEWTVTVQQVAGTHAT
jgi:hypothetical protein